jgi:hypothetical protein
MGFEEYGGIYGQGIKNENASMCGTCGGQSCKAYPGLAWPDDFWKDIESGLYEALSSGNWEIDWWEGYLDGVSCLYFIRPAVKIDDRNRDKCLRRGLWTGECIFLGKQGCSLIWDKRPTQCKALKPGMKDGKPECDYVGDYDKDDCDKAWVSYKETIERVAAKISIDSQQAG